MTSPKDPDRHVEINYSDEYFFGGAAGYPNYLDQKDLIVQNGYNYARVLSEYIINPGKVLDVGAAAGFFLKGLMEMGWQGQGIEPNERMAVYGREKLAVDVEPGTIESFKSSNRYDLVCFIQVLAHLIDPRRAIEASSAFLNNGGYVLIETWNWKSRTARILGRHWHEYSPPTVLYWFSPESLDQLMGQLSFEFIASGRPKKRIIWKHAKSVILPKMKNLPWVCTVENLLNLIPEHFILPYPAEDLFWALYKRTN